METQAVYQAGEKSVIVVELSSTRQLSKLLLVGWTGSVKDAVDYYHKRFHREPTLIQRYKADCFMPVSEEE
jgi:hypothetical protein